MSEVIVVTSGKGGVGKTTSTANIGAGLARMNKKVVLVDTDIGLRNLDVVMGLENRIIYNLVDVVEGNCRVKQALIRDKHYPGLYLLPSAQTRDKSAVSPEQMIKLADSLTQIFDYVILDCPAGTEQGFRNATAAAHHRTSGGRRAQKDRPRRQSDPGGHGAPRRDDVGGGRARYPCGASSGRGSR